MSKSTVTAAVAYLRRSNPDTRNGRGEISKEQQLEAVRRMAAEDGHDPDRLVILEGDWGKSGRDAKLADRKDWERLVGMVERGEASHVYAYEMSRLGRSVMQTARLATVARDRGVPVRCAVGISPDYSTPEGEMMTNTLANIHQYYGSAAAARAQANVASRRSRGDDLGSPPYGLMRGDDGRHIPNPDEDVGAVLDAYDRAGSFLGAAKLLTAEGRVPPRRADHWDGSTVARVVRAHRHVGKVDQGVKQKADWILFRLLRCPCGKTLTAQRDRHGAVGYLCKRAVQDPRHPRPYFTSERKLIDWVKAEADRLQLPEAGGTLSAGDNDDSRQAIADRLAKYAELYAEGGPNGITRERYDAEKARATRELDELEQSEALLATVPAAIDWSKEPGSVNEVLRAMWRHVQLNESMQPVAAEWMRPEWRRA